jgi:plastocyanin
MSSEPACAKSNPAAAASREVLTGANGALANVVVFVKSGLDAYRFDPPKAPAVLDQNGCAYDPRVVALMANQPLEIRNDDATIHNVHATPKRNEEWNKAQRAGAPPLTVSFPRPEIAIPFMCNVHPWMRAFVFVFAHPYFAVTTTTGQFELKNLPPGTYTIEAWHEKLGIQDQSVTLAPHAAQTISFRFRSGAASANQK